jgi:hypothetical protein
MASMLFNLAEFQDFAYLVFLEGGVPGWLRE